MSLPTSFDAWNQFLQYAKSRCSATAFNNWLAPIEVLESTPNGIKLGVPNVFMQEYLLSNYKKDLIAFLPLDAHGEPQIEFVITAAAKAPAPTAALSTEPLNDTPIENPEDYWTGHRSRLNNNYTFDTFIEGPTNQFVKSAAIGVANRPALSYNPLFIHGGVGLGKTHLLHSISQHIMLHHKKLRIQCITTEAFINDLVDSLRNKSVDRMKRYYRSDVDVLLVDDIQFLQNRLNFEEEFSNTFETLINQNKQIVITSDKPPAQLKLSERIVARMEWGLVAHVSVPEVETRVAILQHKAQLRGLKISNEIAFFIAEHVYGNVRQLEGAINRLCAHSRLLNMDITQELVETTLRELLQTAPRQKISVEQIFKSVAAVFQVRISDLKSSGRTKEVALPRQVAMYLACKMIKESLQILAAYFGRTHSTLLHACKSIEKRVSADELLRRQIGMVERNIQA